MLAVQGYYDGTAIQTLEKINARPNQRVIITIMDEFLTPAINAERKSMRGVLAQCGAFLHSLPIQLWQKKKKAHGKVQW